MGLNVTRKPAKSNVTDDGSLGGSGEAEAWDRQRRGVRLQGFCAFRRSRRQHCMACGFAKRAACAK